MPPNRRVYAIGDVHGCFDALEKLLGMIEEDDAAREPATVELIFLGDLMDRGPDSARTLARVRELVAGGRARLVKGNHEEIFVEAARGNREATRGLTRIGGLATLRSFGIAEEEAEQGSFTDLAELLVRRIPRDVVDFLDAAEDKVLIGDYLFVHAGIRPGVAIDDQEPADLRWIRREFLEHRGSHGVVVVHGHTPSERIEVRHNRIGIDTGAYMTGALSAVGLEGQSRWYLSTGTPGIATAD